MIISGYFCLLIMGNEMITYFDRLELLAFFSGYPLIYFIILSFVGNKSKTAIKDNLIRCLPLGYALTGALYWGLQSKNLYPDYSLAQIQFPILKIWGLLAILFWLPVFRKKVIISLLHSLVFLYLILKTIFFQLFSKSTDKDFFKNDMKIYFDSILLNTATFIAIVILFLLIQRLKKNKISSSSPF